MKVLGLLLLLVLAVAAQPLCFNRETLCDDYTTAYTSRPDFATLTCNELDSQVGEGQPVYDVEIVSAWLVVSYLQQVCVDAGSLECTDVSINSGQYLVDTTEILHQIGSPCVLE